MRDFAIDFAKPNLFLARVARITRRDGVVKRFTDAEVPITVDAETFAPLEGAEISAVRHMLGGDIPSLEITFAHAAGGSIDTADLHAGDYDGATVEVYVVERTLAAAPIPPEPQPASDDDYAGWLIAA